jgi:hypothetical protein
VQHLQGGTIFQFRQARVGEACADEVERRQPLELAEELDPREGDVGGLE